MKHHRTDAARAFGRALRNARQVAGLSQEKLAERGDFDRTYPSLLERGLRTPTFAVIICLAEALDADPVQLFSTAITNFRESRSAEGIGDPVRKPRRD